jgi:hypothetical protein
MTIVERRLFGIGALLLAAGTLLTGVLFGLKAALSFLAGGSLGAASLAWLRHTVNSLVFSDPRRSASRILGGYLLRLVLIPLCLYVMIRFLFAGIIAAVAGFAAFNCSIFIEGLLEAFKGSAKSHARIK